MATLKSLRYSNQALPVDAIDDSFKDWPPTDNFVTEFPDMFGIFEDCLVGRWLTSRTGVLNLEASMPAGSCPPDTGVQLAQNCRSNSRSLVA